MEPRTETATCRHHLITVDPAVQRGLPVVAGTRVTVDAVCGLWEAGWSLEAILAELPALTAQDVTAAVAYDRDRRTARP